MPGDDLGPVVERAAYGTEARAVLRRSVEALDADSRRKGDHIFRNAVWVPDPGSGVVAAVLDATVRRAPGGDSAPHLYLSRSVRRDFGWTTRIVDYAASESEVSAGHLTIEQALVRPLGDRTVQAYLILRVFPPQCDEAFSLFLNTVHLDLVDDLALHGRSIADSLELTRGHIPGGRRGR